MIRIVRYIKTVATTLRKQDILRIAYNVSAIVVLIALYIAACTVIWALIETAIKGNPDYTLRFWILNLILIPILVVVSYKLTCLVMYLRKWFAEFVQKAKKTWVSLLIVIVHVAASAGMIFVCYWSCFLSLFWIGCLNGYHG